LTAAVGVAPVRHAEGADVPAGCPAADRGGKADGGLVPLLRVLPNGHIRIEQQVRRVRGQPGEGRVQDETDALAGFLNALRLTARRARLARGASARTSWRALPPPRGPRVWGRSADHPPPPSESPPVLHPASRTRLPPAWRRRSRWRRAGDRPPVGRGRPPST